MEYIEGKCPKCGGELRTPIDLENIICMYCGVTIKKGNLILPLQENDTEFKTLEKETWDLWENNDVTARGKAEELLNLEKDNFIANYVYAMSSIQTILLDNMRLQFCFQIKKYPKEMEEYIEKSKSILKALEKVCLMRENEKDQIVKEAAHKFVFGIKDKLDEKSKSKSVYKSELESYKFILTLFTIPMILEQRLSISKPLTESIHTLWNETFVDFQFKIGTYEELNNGFKRKGWCYITTAVCDSFHKNDDCYELTMFRLFREEFLRKEENGEQLIQEYYTMAPKIVENINLNLNSSMVYKEIWDKYLSTCLTQIEKGQNIQCKNHYIKMMKDLECKWGAVEKSWL